MVSKNQKQNLESVIEDLQQKLNLEEGLERVRIKALDMKRSEDLSMVALAIYEELDLMGFENIRCGIGVVHNNKKCEMWTTTTSETGEVIQVVGDETLSDHPLLEGIFDSWFNQKPFSYILEGKDMEEYYRTISLTNYQLPQSAISFKKSELKHYFKAVFCPAGGLYAYREAPFTKMEEYIMQRFADTFYLGFTRYQDLGKSEIKAKEAEIEIALERITKSSMAMQSSDDLMNVAAVLREQLAGLGQGELESSLVHLYNDDLPNFTAWFAYKKLNIDPIEILTGEAIVNKNSTSWGRKVMSLFHSSRDEYTILSESNMLDEWYQELEIISATLPEGITLVDYDKKGKIIVPTILYYHFSKFSGGALLMISNDEPTEEAKMLQKRASVVFDAAYVRFLDLLKLENQAKKLAELNDLKNTLYTNITHEFRTPLTVINGMVDILRDDLGSKNYTKVTKSLDLIKRNSNGLLHLVNQMLDLAKVESGNMELQLVQADVVPFLKYVSESFHALADQANVKLYVFSKVAKLVLDFDSEKLSTIVTNLISNAIKFTPSGGEVELFVNKVVINGEEHLECKIKDTGKGISEEDLPIIFNRFYQVDSALTRAHEGTGIGLSLTKELIELMGGMITVESTLGKGSSFVFLIPVNNCAVNKIKDEHNAHTLSNFLVSTKESVAIEETPSDVDLPVVLIVEDNADVAYYLESCLMEEYQTFHVFDGLAGMDAALEKIPDIIISDVMMPVMDGFELCDNLKSNYLTEHIPIILLTAKATLKDRLTGLKYGADAYLAKPFIKEELFTRLDQLIAQRKKLQRKFENAGFSQLLNKPIEDHGANFIKRVVEIIQEDILDYNFGVVHLSNKLQLSESQTYRKLKAITGRSVVSFIKLIKLQKAKELIGKTKLTISEIAYDCGFSDPSYFSRAFKEEFGFAPTHFREI